MVTVEYEKSDGFWYLCEWDGAPYENFPPIPYLKSKDRAELEEKAKRINEEGLDPWSLCD